MTAVEPLNKPAKTETISSKDKAIVLARWAMEKKAGGIAILDLESLNTLTEYFVICSGRSVRQTRAISEHIQARCKKSRLRALGAEGTLEGTWILLDYDDVVVHIFHEPTRELYSLEKLWSDAPLVIDPEIREAQAQLDQEDQEDGGWDL